MDLDARLLRYFVAVAEELNFSRAAQRLHMSQPPLSHAIKQLETGLGVQLFTRTSRRVQMTDAGRTLYQEAVFLLRRHHDVKQLVHRIGEGLQGQIKIGFVGSMIYRNLSRALEHCQALYPDVEQIWLEMNSVEQITLIERGGLDIGIIHANPVPQQVRNAELSSEPFVICVPLGHALSNTDRTTLSQLKDENFILFSRDLSPRYYEILLAMYLEAGFYPSVRFEVRHWLSVTSLVSQGMGISIVPECLSRAGLTGVHFLQFEHAHQSVNDLIWSADNRSAIIDNYTTALQDYYLTQR